MSDLVFEAHVSWMGAAGEPRGAVRTGGQSAAWSVPVSMGGLGEGVKTAHFVLDIN